MEITTCSSRLLDDSQLKLFNEFWPAVQKRMKRFTEQNKYCLTDDRIYDIFLDRFIVTIKKHDEDRDSPFDLYLSRALRWCCIDLIRMRYPKRYILDKEDYYRRRIIHESIDINELLEGLSKYEIEFISNLYFKQLNLQQMSETYQRSRRQINRIERKILDKLGRT